jgi:hypothetical protein
MYIVPNFPHLRNLQLQVQYRELPPDDSWLDKLTFPGKWRQDADADSNLGYAPATKIYVNGMLLEEERAKLAQTSKTPFPAQRHPRQGNRQVLPSDPDYEKACVEQGLEHLLQDRGLAINGHNGHIVALNGQMGITPPESTNGEMLRLFNASSLGLPTTSVETLDPIPKGINGIL